jgi:hypothetical protein
VGGLALVKLILGDVEEAWISRDSTLERISHLSSLWSIQPRRGTPPPCRSGPPAGRQARGWDDQLLPVLVKFTMTFLTEPQKIVNRLMKNAVVRQMGTFNPIGASANLTLALGPHTDGER